MSVQYADSVKPYKIYLRPTRKFGPLQMARGQSASGYGQKITSDYCLVFEGEVKERRVYITCHSNVASHWINFKGQRLYLRSHTQDEVINGPVQ